jgi:hypothetical protein
MIERHKLVVSEQGDAVGGSLKVVDDPNVLSFENILKRRAADYPGQLRCAAHAVNHWPSNAEGAGFNR